MIRTLKLEWLKQRNYRVFWVLLGMYLFALFAVASLGMIILEWIKSLEGDFNGIDPTIVPIYDFPDIWQNITWAGSFVKILLGFIVIISVSNDISYNTMKQNIIDGISKREFLLSKAFLILFLAAFSTLFLFLAGLINGSLYSHVWGAEFIFDEFEFLAAHFFSILVFCFLAFLLALVIKKAGFVIVALFLYTILFEPMAGVILTHAPWFQGTWMASLVPFFPIESLSNLIPVPFPKYIFREIEDNVPIRPLLISTVYLFVYVSGIVLILNKRDLK